MGKVKITRKTTTKARKSKQKKCPVCGKFMKK